MTSISGTTTTPLARDAFLRAMRRVASSVAVVSTDGPAGCHGATVSAFSSVSADPPMVLVCLRSGSRIADAVTANGKLCVNVLPQDRHDLANRFSGRDDHQIKDRFLGVDYFGDQGVAPEIQGATIFSGSVEQIVAAGSHSIFICQVLNVREGAAAPLTYLDGNYHSVVPQITTSRGEKNCSETTPQ
jgi:flavin reductase (DIM6/NTAB) family NADH-FMN oxidoreductase RutF